MILPSPILEIFGVYDRGIPNLERIVLRANGPVNLSEFAIVLGFVGGTNNIYPLVDQFMWLGDIELHIQSWVFIFTGPGKPGVSQEVNTKEPLHSIFWNKPNVIFGNPDLVPALVQLGPVLIGNRPNRSIADLKKQEPPISASDFMKLMDGSRS